MARSSAAARRVHPAASYDGYYAVLDLAPGSPSQEIEDRVRLLRAAFQVEGLPPALRQPVLDRAGAIEHAATELRHYWRTHRKAPPSAITRIRPFAGAALLKAGVAGLAGVLALLVYYGADRIVANAADNTPPVGAAAAPQPGLMTAMPRPLGAFAQPEARYSAPR